MRLISLHLENFKGVKEFKFQPNGKSMLILGENATGKTTVFDAFQWLLTGKDSLDQAAGNFEIKTITAMNGEVAHGIAHSAEAVFDLENGDILKLKKVYAEKYTKKRGASRAELTGHVTDHYIDDVPRSQREFQAVVAEMADEKLFRLLTNVRYFNEGLSWQDRRRILLDAFGDVSDAEVIASDPQLADLSDLLGKRTVEDWRKIAATDKTRLNKELTEIPARIDEAGKSKADVGEATRVTLENELVLLQAERKAKMEERQRVESGGEIAAKTKALREIEGKLQALTNTHSQLISAAAEAWDQKTRAISQRRIGFEQEKASLESLKSSMLYEINSYESAMADLREKWNTRNAETFEFSLDPVCPACGQDLPEERVSAVREKALGDFNQNKSTDLASIRANGHRLKDEVEKIQKAKEGVLVRLTEIDESLHELNKELMEFKDRPSATPVETPEQKADRETLEAGKAILEGAIAELRLGNHDALSELDKTVSEIDRLVAVKQSVLAQIDGNYRIDKRIRELSQQLKTLAAEFEKIEAGMFLTDLFVRKKVAMIDEKINSLFPSVRFKMGEFQINGAYNDQMCEATINGVPYRNLNEAARIAAGCEVAEVLSEHFGVWLPRWIDGAESIISIPPSKGQIIVLVVSKGHPRLTVTPMEG